MRRAGSAVAALFALAGCVAEPPLPAASAPADGSSWVLAAFGDSPAPRASLSFEGARVVGSGPCNSFFGDFAREGDRVAIGPIAATKRACPDLEAESAFLGALTDTARAELRERDLVLLDAAGRALMRFAPGI